MNKTGVSLTALVPIKSYSERLPNKNFLKFGTEPLFMHILRTLSESDLIEKVCINTDSEIVIDKAPLISKKIEIVERPTHLREPHITSKELIAHDLQVVAGEHFLQTHVTNPLVQKKTIENAIVTYFDNLHKFDSVFSVTAVKKRGYTKDTRPINHTNQTLLPTQDLDEILIENSNFFIFSRNSFFQNNQSRIGKRPYAFYMNEMEAIDIDYPEDFVLATLIYENKHLFGFFENL